MSQTRLNDAAILLCEALSSSGITHGFFGGFAVNEVLGGLRESKDIDCLASATGDEIVTALKKYSCFRVIPQSRPDFVAILWTGKALAAKSTGRNPPVSLKIFVDKFSGFQYNMSDVRLVNVPITGHTRGSRVVTLIDPVLTFKGKLDACANRGLQSDAVDLGELAVRYETEICEHATDFSTQKIRLAIARHPELHYVFVDLGLGLRRASRTAQQLRNSESTAPRMGEVQQGLLRMSKMAEPVSSALSLSSPSSSRIVSQQQQQQQPPVVFKIPIWSVCPT